MVIRNAPPRPPREALIRLGTPTRETAPDANWHHGGAAEKLPQRDSDESRWGSFQLLLHVLRPRAGQPTRSSRGTNNPAMMTEVIVTEVKPPTSIFGHILSMRYCFSSSSFARALHASVVMMRLGGKP